ncbi:uncharacterized protein KIAA1143 homolog isoform X2 [Schistocerca serialis cubense]|uniref:uncharacterized protein KIAA1143 homolog isoform X2 n=1 Tax=Schistocerca serialis cubense TaxID=2023355 RepID=UPI00214EE50E|nr:uncharacterized protein KIAA1143 homolog isoform X2 [Schistocerca serialis cubense]
MSKRNTVSYVKPQEPAFLTRLKQEAGFVPKDTVETKKVTLPSCTDDDLDDKDDEQPVVVVLKPGDISAEEAEQIKAEQLQKASEAPADLNQRVVFRAPSKPTPAAEPDGGGRGSGNSGRGGGGSSSSSSRKRVAAGPEGPQARARPRRAPASTSLLSFGDGDDQEVED